MLSFWDKWLGCPIRTLPTNEPNPTLYLTFDDGPVAGMTEKILALLEAHKARATFFVIGEKSLSSPHLIQKILQQKSSIGNHSLDHNTRKYFNTKKGMLKWIQHSEELLLGHFGNVSVGFRPPVGIRTPELRFATEKLGIPIILWNHRFYDSLFLLKKKRIESFLNRAEDGNIVLLHENQRNRNRRKFLENLHYLLEQGRQRGFKFEAITKEITKNRSVNI